MQKNLTMSVETPYTISPLSNDTTVHQDLETKQRKGIKTSMQFLSVLKMSSVIRLTRKFTILQHYPTYSGISLLTPPKGLRQYGLNRGVVLIGDGVN